MLGIVVAGSDRVTVGAEDEAVGSVSGMDAIWFPPSKGGLGAIWFPPSKGGLGGFGARISGFGSVSGNGDDGKNDWVAFPCSVPVLGKRGGVGC